MNDAGFLIIAAVVGFVCGLIINAIFCAIISGWLKHVPQQFQAMTPGQVWLLMIPIFNFYWMFRVYMMDVPQSFKNYFNSIGRADVGDCGKSLGMWLCIMTLLSFIPIVGGCFGLACLVLIILWLVKINGLKKQIATQTSNPIQ